MLMKKAQEKYFPSQANGFMHSNVLQCSALFRCNNIIVLLPIRLHYIPWEPQKLVLVVGPPFAYRANQIRHERISNSHYGNGVPAMFTS